MFPEARPVTHCPLGLGPGHIPCAAVKTSAIPLLYIADNNINDNNLSEKKIIIKIRPTVKMCLYNNRLTRLSET